MAWNVPESEADSSIRRTLRIRQLEKKVRDVSVLGYRAQVFRGREMDDLFSGQ